MVKYMCRFICSIVLVLLGFQVAKAQVSDIRKTDSILKSVDTLAPKARNKVYQNTIISLMHVDVKRALNYSHMGLERSSMEKDTAAMAAYANFLGVGYWMVSQIDSSVLFLRKSIVWADLAKDERRSLLSRFALANTFSKAGMPDSAISYFYSVLPYFEKVSDYKSIGATKVNIAILYKNMGHNEQAKQLFNEALPYAEKAEDPTLYGNVYRGMGLFEADFEKRIIYYNRALENFCKAGNVFEESVTLATIGWDSYTVKGNTAKALDFLQRALKLSEEHEFNTLIADQSGQLADIYISTKEAAKAEEYTQKAEKYAEKDNQILMQRLEERLLSVYILKGDVNKALEVYKNRIARITKQNEERMLNTLSEKEVKYETEKKELRIALLEKQRKLIVLLSLLGGFVLVLVIVLIAVKQKVASQKRKLAEQKIIQLEQEKQLIATQALLEGETAERTRLSKDLHDGLGGLLSVTKHKISNLKGNLTIPDDQVEVFNSALEMIESSIKELRRVAHNLMPESLLRYGLNAALGDFCKSIENVQYQFYGMEKRIDEKTEVAAYRVVSELVNNALKHSSAKVINVQLVQDNERISLNVYDDGCGFDREVVAQKHNGGLKNIESRVVSLNGRMDIISAPGKGTEVSVEFKI